MGDEEWFQRWCDGQLAFLKANHVGDAMGSDDFDYALMIATAAGKTQEALVDGLGLKNRHSLLALMERHGISWKVDKEGTRRIKKMMSAL